MAESKTCSVLSTTMSYNNDEKTQDSLPQRPNAFVIDWGEKKDSSLQEAFLKFQKERQREVRQTRKMRKKRKVKKDPARLKALRAKFIEQAKKYFGVPYARKYWSKDTPEYNSPMFLDCCGLVRQVVRDMKKDLGFRLGPWNQSYMFDTLPVNVKQEKMKPGDLVFMSGIYTNPKSKKQRHNMTHVEIWLGEGEKTIGARWNNGKVQIFDSYRFSAKSFHSERYYFKSIDTWLMGICKSYCPIHPWKRSKFNPSKKSVFNPAPDQSDQNEPDEAASGEEADFDTPTSSGLDLHEDLLTPLSTVSSSNPDLDSVDVSECPETPSSDRDEIFGRKTSIDMESNLDEYLTSGSESDVDDNDEQPWDTYSQEERPKIPAVAFSYILDSDDDDDFGGGISYIHSSKSSGCLSLKPPKTHPSMSSSSLPELELDDSVSFDGPSDVKTAWNQPQDQAKSPEYPGSSQKDHLAQGPAKKSDDIPQFCLGNERNGSEIDGSLSKNGSFASNSIPSSILGHDSSSFEDDFYCEAECSSETCDPDMEPYECIDSNYDNDGDETYDYHLFESLPETWIDPVQSDQVLRENTVESRLSLISCTDEEEPLFRPKPPRTVKSLPIISAMDASIPMSTMSSGLPVSVKSSPSFINMKDESGTFKPSTQPRTVKSSPSIITLMVGDGGVMEMSPKDADTKTDNSESTDNSSSSQNGGSDSTPSGGDGGSGRRDGGKSPGRGGGGKKTPGGKPTKLPTCSLANNMTPSFYIGGGNGVALVEAPLLALGWKRTSDKYDERFRLKWVECKSRINYSAFREGDQLVNHIANCHLLTNKMGLLNSLQEYERVTLSTKGRLPRLKMAEFVPETYRLDQRDDRETFLEVYKDNEIWISKPTGMNQGKGIFLLRTKEEIDKLLLERDAKQQNKRSRPLMSRIVQRYIHNPLLLDERKFDIRAYMLIASTVPYLVLYHKGYIRLSCQKYDGEDTNLSTHLTNQFIQKKVPNYSEVKEETAWSMDKFNDYINEKVAAEKGIEQDWTYNYLTKQIQRIMLHCFNSVKHKLQCKVGFFDLYGLDFMIDQDMKVWLIEINTNPCLATNCSALFEVIPSIVQETLYLSLECFEKGRKNQKLLPLNSLKSFTVLYCGSNPNAVAARQTRSVSPAKENSNDKSKTNLSPSAPRRGPSPTRPAVPRMAITSTNVTQTPYQPRRTEFSTILTPQGASNGKGLNSARVGQRTNSITAKSAGTAHSGNSGTDRSKVSGVNKNNSAQVAKSDPKTSASTKTGDIKTSGDAKTSGDVKTRKGSGGTSPKSDSSDKTSNQTKSSAADKSTVPATKVLSSTKTSPSNSKVNSSSGSKPVVSQDKNGASGGGTPKVTSSSSSKSGASNPPKAKTVGKSASAEKVGKETDNQTKKDKPSTPPKEKTSRKQSPESKTKSDSTKTKDSKPLRSDSKSPKSDFTSTSNATSNLDSTSKPFSTFKSDSTSPKLDLKSTKAEESGPVDNIENTTVNMSSHSGTGEDVKLKMTHATDSDSRKNRPRADTGN